MEEQLIKELPENKPGSPIDEDKEPSPFKIYEDKYCSRCQDYPGCIGLIDNIAVNLQNPDTYTGLPVEMVAVVKHMVQSTGSGAGQRFGIIATCMGARHHMEDHVKKPKNNKRKKVL